MSKLFYFMIKDRVILITVRQLIGLFWLIAFIVTAIITTR